jgi:hypothetical protein
MRRRAVVSDGTRAAMRASMVTKHNLPHEKPQDRVKHPDAWEADLNPFRGAGQTPGARQPATRLASEDKHIVRMLHDFTMAELAEIPVIEAGERLTIGATYLDLADPTRRELLADGAFIAAEGNFYVPKADVPYMLWNRLLRVSSERHQ